MKLSLAPIQGLTLAYYRNSFAHIFGGIDDYYAPFIDTNEHKNPNPKLFKDLLPQHNTPTLKVIPQLLGNNGVHFRHFANAIKDMGYSEVNWNIGCPFPMVTNKKKGSGLLPYPDLIKNFLDEACKGSTSDLTVKMRLGLHSLEEGIKVMDVLNDYPLKGVIIHGRTGKQMYTGSVDLDSFEVLYKACKHEVTYNGDIFTAEDFTKISARFPDITRFMLGRGALRDPFLPALLKNNKAIPTAQKITLIKEFHDAAYNHYKSILSGEKHLFDKMKEFWTYTAVHLDSDGKFIKKIRKCHSISAYLDCVNQIFDASNVWKETL